MQNTNFSCACGQIPPSLVLARFKCQYNTELTLLFRLYDKTLMTVIITIERSSEGARLHFKARPGGRFRVSASALPVADLNLAVLKLSRNHGVEWGSVCPLFFLSTFSCSKTKKRRVRTYYVSLLNLIAQK